MRALVVLGLALVVSACSDDGPAAPDTLAPDTAILSGPSSLTRITSATFELSASPVGDAAGYECRVGAAAFAPCAASASVDVPDGTHVFEARAVDAAGNVDASPATSTWTVDTVAPSVAITAGPDGEVAAAEVSFMFTAGSDATNVQCAIDAAFTSCVSPFSSSTLAQGAHVFTVRVEDLAGNEASTTRSFVVDTIAPTVAITAGPIGPTNIATPMFSFTTGGNPTATTCRIDAGAATPCIAPFVAPALADGAHTFSVDVVDAAGNTGTATRSFAVDTVPPSVTITGGPSGPTNVAVPTFTFASSGDPLTVECRIDGEPFTSCTTATSHAASALADGAHTFDVRVTDAASNTTTASRAFVLDRQGPTVAITAGPSGPVATVEVTFTFATTGDVATVECRFDTAAFAACAGSVTATLAEGPHAFEVRVADLAGNTSGTSRAFTIDVTPPSVTIVGGPAGPTSDPTPAFLFTTAGEPASTRCRIDAGSYVDCTSPFTTHALGGGAHTFEVVVADAAGNLDTATRSFSVDTTAPSVSITSAPPAETNLTTPVFTFTAPDAATVSCALDGVPGGPCTSPHTLAPVAEGEHTFVVTACNTASVCSTDGRTFRVDVTPPALVIDFRPLDPTRDPVAVFGFTATGSPQSVACRITSAAMPDPAFVPCSGVFTSPALADGTYVFEVRAIDAATNVGTATATFTIDTVAPIVAITSGPVGPTDAANPVFGFTVTGADIVRCAFDGAVPVTCATTFAPGGALAEGPHELGVLAIDAAGNSTLATRTFTVDTIDPIVTIAGPGTSPPTADSSPAFTISTQPGGTQPVVLRCRLDGAGGFVPCASLFTPGSLADGAHVLEVEAEDPATNTGAATHAFRIDTQAPAITIVAPLIAARTNDPRPSVSFTVTDESSVTTTCAIDDGGFAPCVTGFAPAVDLDEGPHAYHVRATDEAGTPTTVDVAFIVDRTPPDAVLTMTPATPGDDTTPAFHFTHGADAAVVRCTLDTGQLVEPCMSPVTFDAANGGPVAAGLHTFTLTVADNAVAPNTRVVTFDFEIAVCGDGARTGTEACEGSDVGTTTCASFPPFDGGTLSCDASCRLVTAACSDCGNGAVEGGEECDGAPLAGVTCAGEGYDGGAIACSAATCQLDTTSCSDYAAYGTGFPAGSNVCFGGLRHSKRGDALNLFACMGTAGMYRAPLATGAWTAFNPNGSLTEQNGRGFEISPNGPPQIYFAAGSSNIFRRQASNVNANWQLQASTLAELYSVAYRAPVGNLAGSWSAANGAMISHGNLGNVSQVLYTQTLGVTGIPRSIATGGASTTEVDVLVAVYGQNGAATGGIFRSCDLTAPFPTPPGSGTWSPRSTGIGEGAEDPGDLHRIWSITVDHNSYATVSCGAGSVSGATIYYAALRGGGQVYKTVDNGATWQRRNTGLPPGAEVYEVVVDCFWTLVGATQACHDSQHLYAATSAGLYRSTNGGESWFLDGFAGQVVRAVTLEPLRVIDLQRSRVYAAIDGDGVYRLQ